MNVVILWVAGGLGAVCRILLDAAVTARGRRWVSAHTPLGTFTVNVVGALLLGGVTGLSRHAGWPPGGVSLLSAGFLGGFTTLSTAVLEVVRMCEDGRYRPGLAYTLASLAAGGVAYAAGLAVGAV